MSLDSDFENYQMSIAIAISTGVASLWPIGLLAHFTWPAGVSNEPNEPSALAFAYFLGAVGGAFLVTCLVFMLLRLTILRSSDVD